MKNTITKAYLFLILLLITHCGLDIENKSYREVSKKIACIDTVRKDTTLYRYKGDTTYTYKRDTFYRDTVNRTTYKKTLLPYYIQVIDSTKQNLQDSVPLLYFKRYLPDIYYYPDKQGLPPQDEKQGLKEVAYTENASIDMPIQSFYDWQNRRVNLEEFDVRRLTLAQAQAMIDAIPDTSFIKYVRQYDPVAKEYDHIFKQYRPGRNFATGCKNILGIGFHLPNDWRVNIHRIVNHTSGEKSRFFHRLVYEDSKGFNDRTNHYIYTYPQYSIDSLESQMNQYRQGEFRLLFVPEKTIDNYDYTLSFLLEKKNNSGQYVARHTYNCNLQIRVP